MYRTILTTLFICSQENAPMYIEPQAYAKSSRTHADSNLVPENVKSLTINTQAVATVATVTAAAAHAVAWVGLVRVDYLKH
jgi:hypothetical protein